MSLSHVLSSTHIGPKLEQHGGTTLKIDRSILITWHPTHSLLLTNDPWHWWTLRHIEDSHPWCCCHTHPWLGSVIYNKAHILVLPWRVTVGEKLGLNEPSESQGHTIDHIDPIFHMASFPFDPNHMATGGHIPPLPLHEYQNHTWPGNGWLKKGGDHARNSL